MWKVVTGFSRDAISKTFADKKTVEKLEENLDEVRDIAQSALNATESQGKVLERVEEQTTRVLDKMADNLEKLNSAQAGTDAKLNMLIGLVTKK